VAHGSGPPRVSSRKAALYGGSDPDNAPRGLTARILELGEELRGEGVAVGTSELLDAFSVLREVPWARPADFKEGLAATLAKPVHREELRRCVRVALGLQPTTATEAGAKSGVRSRGDSSD